MNLGCSFNSAHAESVFAVGPPFFTPVQTYANSPLRTSSYGSGELGIDSALVRVPSQHRSQIDGFVTNVRKIRVDCLVWQAAEPRKQVRAMAFRSSQRWVYYDS